MSGTRGRLSLAKPISARAAGFACALVALAVPASASADRSTLFNQPGTYTYLVGPGVTSLQVQAIGGNGGRDSTSSGAGGRGAVIAGDLPVIPGQILTVVVGGNGQNTTDPTATITTPADSASYTRGQVGNADFSCADEADNAGNDFTRTFHYRVTDTADPSATIVSPVDGASVHRGEIVNADYSCSDEAGGPGSPPASATSPTVIRSAPRASASRPSR